MHIFCSAFSRYFIKLARFKIHLMVFIDFYINTDLSAAKRECNFILCRLAKRLGKAHIGSRRHSGERVGAFRGFEVHFALVIDSISWNYPLDRAIELRQRHHLFWWLSALIYFKRFIAGAAFEHWVIWLNIFHEIVNISLPKTPAKIETREKIICSFVERPTEFH